jgi:hypothetical protein
MDQMSEQVEETRLRYINFIFIMLVKSHAAEKEK